MLMFKLRCSALFALKRQVHVHGPGDCGQCGSSVGLFHLWRKHCTWCACSVRIVRVLELFYKPTHLFDKEVHLFLGCKMSIVFDGNFSMYLAISQCIASPRHTLAVRSGPQSLCLQAEVM